MTLTGEQLTFRYTRGGREILSGVDIRIESGERVGLIAPSGYGKTTLCRLLAGYEAPLSGRVCLDGAPLYPHRGPCPVQLIGQHPELCVNPRLRMADVLREGGQVPPHIHAGLGIERGWLRRFPAELSGGELQRFCIARALGGHTRFLLADEITTMLDLVTQAQIWRFLMEETERRGMGLLAVSHSPSLLAQVCTRIVRM